MNDSTKRRRCTLPIIVLILAALLLPAFFNPYIFYGTQSLLFSCASYVASAGLTLFLLTLSCRIRTVGFIALPVIFVCALGCWYVYHLTGTFMCEAILGSIMDTDANEAWGYVSVANVSFTVLAIAAVVTLILAGHKLVAPKVSNIILVASLAVFGIATAVSYPVGKAERKNNVSTTATRLAGHAMFWPVYDVHSVRHCTKDYLRNSPRLYSNIIGLPSGHVPRAEGTAPAEDDVIVVMMIGETVRADHLQINGYERETTPRLNEWLQKGQLVSFRNTCSFGVLTRICLVGLMTDAEVNNRMPQHRPYFDMLTLDGVETARLMPMDVSSHFTLLSRDCKHTYRFDEGSMAEGHARGITVARYREALGGLASAPRAFLLMYDMGAHGPYQSLPANKKYLPDNVIPGKGADLEMVRNSYDNAILEVDWELGELMDELEKTGRPAVLVYASDHGEALGESGLFYHGIVLEPVYRPALMLWFSSAYKAKHPDCYANVVAHADKSVSHDHLMHTVLSLCGIRRGAYRPDLDLTATDIRETSTPQDPSILEKVLLPGQGEKE